MKNRIDLGVVSLRPITLDDTDLIVRWRNTDRVRKNFLYQKPFTAEGHLQWMETKVASGEVIQFILCETEGMRPIGSVYFRDIDPVNRKAEYGIFIGEEDAAGKGYGTLAAKGAVAYARDELKLHKLMLRVFEDNVGAVKSYEKAGFVREACLKDEIWQKNDCLQENMPSSEGFWRNLLLMAVIFEEN